MMVLIVILAGGDTDTSKDYEYTDRGAAGRFAETFAQRLGSPRKKASAEALQ